MLNVRCPICHRKFAKREDQIGQTFSCSCKELLKVPKRSGDARRVRSLAERSVEFAVYGAGGAVVGLVLAVVLFSRLRILPGDQYALLVWPIVGFVAGGVFGETGANFVGRLIRDREERD